MGESEVEVAQSVQMTIQVLVHAGFVENLLKSKLTPMQDLVYIGATFRMDLGRLYLPELRIQAFIACVRSFSRVGEYKPAHQSLRVLELMAASLQSVCSPSHATHPVVSQAALDCGNSQVAVSRFVNREVGHALSWWLDR